MVSNQYRVMSLGVKLFFGFCPTPNQPGKPSSICFIDIAGVRSFEAHINYPGIDPVQDPLYRRFGEENGSEENENVVECSGDLPYVCARVRAWLYGFPAAPEIWAVSVSDSLASFRMLRITRPLFDLSSICCWVGVAVVDVVSAGNRNAVDKVASSSRREALCSRFVYQKLCFIQNGKKITALIGFSRAEVGSVIGVPGFGDLEGYIGKKVEVYAQDNSDGTYTLYGSAGFYIKVL